MEKPPNPKNTAPSQRPALSIADFLQINNEKIIVDTFKKINELFPLPGDAADAASNSKFLSRTIDLGSEASGLGPITQGVLDKMSLWTSLYIASENQAKATVNPRSEVVTTTMKNIKKNMMAHSKEIETLPPCANPHDKCVFSSLCREVMLPGCEEGNKKGIAWVLDSEWMPLTDGDQTTFDRVRKRACFLCQLATVNFGCLSSEHLFSDTAVAVLNRFNVRVEEEGEFTQDDVLTNPLIHGAFPRYDQTKFVPAIFLLSPNGTPVSAKPTHINKEDEGLTGSELYERTRAGLLESVRDKSDGPDHVVTPGFLPVWQGFHSRGRLSLTPQVVRPITWVLESRAGAEWHPLNLSGNSLSLLTANVLARITVQDPKILEIIHFLSHPFETRRKIVAATGYPFSHRLDSPLIQHCLIMCPILTVIPFRAQNEELYEHIFYSASSSEIKDIGEALLNSYPHHFVASQESCKQSSWYWALMASANLLKNICHQFVPRGSESWDSCVRLLEALAPMFSEMKTVAGIVGNRIPSDEEFSIVCKNFASKQWHPDNQQVIVPLYPSNDTLNVRTGEVVYTEMSRKGQVDFDWFIRTQEDGFSSTSQALSFIQHAGPVEETKNFFLLEAVIRYYLAAPLEEPNVHLVTERRGSCLPLLAMMRSERTFEDEALVKPWMVHQLGGRRTPATLLSLFPVRHTKSSLVQSNLPNYGFAITELMNNLSQTPCLALSEKAAQNVVECELVTEFFHRLFHYLSKDSLGPFPEYFLRCLLNLNITRTVVGCFLMRSFDKLAADDLKKEQTNHCTPETILRTVDRFIFLNSADPRPFDSFLSSAFPLVIVAYILYLDVLLSASPQAWVPFKRIYPDCEGFVDGVVEWACGMGERTCEELYSLSQQAEELVISLARQHLRLRVTFSHFIDTLSFDFSCLRMRHNPESHRILSVNALSANHFRGAFQKVITKLKRAGVFVDAEEEVRVFVWVFFDAFSTGVYREVLLQLAEELLILFRGYRDTGQVDKELSKAWCSRVLKHTEFELLVRLILEELMVYTENGVTEVVHAPCDSRTALAQSGDYLHRGMMGMTKEALATGERMCRSAVLVVTDQNTEIQNAKRYMSGSKLTDLTTSTGELSTIHMRLQGKPSKKKLIRWSKKLVPQFFSMPGRVVVFRKTPFAFRRNKKSLKKVEEVLDSMNKKTGEIVTAFSKIGKGVGCMVGGLREENNNSKVSIKDPAHPSTKLKVQSLVNCTECGTLVEYGLYLFGPWEGMWCRVCSNPEGSVHLSSYCCLCESVIIDPDSPLDKRKFKTDRVDDYGKIKTRKNNSNMPYRKTYNGKGAFYTTLDDMTGQFYEIKTCEVCHEVNELEAIDEFKEPLLLKDLVEVVKNPRLIEMKEQ